MQMIHTSWGFFVRYSYLIVIFGGIFLSACDSWWDIYIWSRFFVEYLYLIRILRKIFSISSWFWFFVRYSIFISHSDSSWDIDIPSDVHISMWFFVIYLYLIAFLRWIFVSYGFFVRYLYLFVILHEILISHQSSSWDIYISSGFVEIHFISPGFFVISHQDSSRDICFSNANVTAKQ